MPSCSASDWYSISTWILVRQEVNTVPEMRVHLEPALALIYPNPLPYFLPDQYPLRFYLVHAALHIRTAYSGKFCTVQIFVCFV